MNKKKIYLNVVVAVIVKEKLNHAHLRNIQILVRLPDDICTNCKNLRKYLRFSVKCNKIS